jgi:hypothetical protein
MSRQSKSAVTSNDRRHVAQLQVLKRFVEEQAEMFALFKYAPFTEGEHIKDVCLRPSTLIPGTVGVFSSAPTCAPKKWLSDYPGVLMWNELHDRFVQRYHCPTAVRCPVLDYTVDDTAATAMGLDPSCRIKNNEWLVGVTLVGDPTRVGALFNSPHGLDGVAPNCIFELIAKENLHSVLSNNRTSNGKTVVKSTLVCVSRNRDAILTDVKETELLVGYDESDGGHGVAGYWNELEYDYCSECFTKENLESNPLIECFLETCAISRHRLCSKVPHRRRSFCDRHQPHVLSSSVFDAPLTPPPTQQVAPQKARPFHFNPDMEITTTPRDIVISPNVLIRHDTATDTAIGTANVATTLHDKFDASTQPTVARTASRYVHCDLMNKERMHTLLSRRHPSSSICRVDVSPPRTVSPVPMIAPISIVHELQTIAMDTSGYVPSEEDDIDTSDEDETSDFVSMSRTGAGSKRVQSRPELRPLKIKVIKPRAISALNEEGVTAVRGLYEKFTPSILSANRRAQWHLRQGDYGTPKEQEITEEVSQSLAQLHSCCASHDRLDELRTSRVGGGLNGKIFRNVLTFLESRLEFRRDFRYSDHAVALVIQQQLMAWSKTLNYQGYPLCDTCFTCALGVSRATMYRMTRMEHTHIQERASCGSAKVLKYVVNELTAYAREYGQFNPTATSVGKGTAEVRVLEHITKAQCRIGLEKYIEGKESQNIPISHGTFLRAIEKCKDQNLVLNMKSSKELAKCTTCVELNNKVDLAKAKGDATEIEIAERCKKEHDEEWQEQRALFDMKKQWCLRCPWELNLLTLDGMDSKKTHMPHYQRLSKDADAAAKSRLPLRVVGGFHFGAAQACLGFASYDDVPSKGANASVTSIQHAIDMNFKAQDTSKWAPIPKCKFDGPIENSHASDETRAAAAAAIDDAASAEAAAAAAAVADSQPGRSSSSVSVNNPSRASSFHAEDFWREHTDEQRKVPFMWSEGLHVTFDNTSGDSKNSTTFRYLALLVAMGIYRYITVSTLMVGHTHDIVDQMFSVWSQRLRENNAPALSDLMKLMRDKYSTKIYELKRHIDKIRRAGERPSDDVSVAARLKELAREFGVQPHMVLQTFIVDVDRWLSLGSISGISSPHCFYIVKETIVDEETKTKREAVVMYNRYLAKSHEDHTVHHNPAYARVRFGPWTTRAIVMEMWQLPTTDPYRCPPQYVDTEVHRQCLNHHFLKEKNMNKAQHDEMMAQLKKFDDTMQELALGCSECARMSKERTAIGVIHRADPTAPDSEESKLSREKEKKKRTLKTQYNKHMADPEFVDQHRTLRVDGWYTQWIERVQTVIEPYYLARRLIAAPSAEQRLITGRAAHPVALVSDKTEPPLRRQRVDQRWRATHPPPKVGDFVLLRGRPWVPIWVGQVKQVGAGREDGENEEYRSKDAFASSSAAAPTRASGRASKPIVRTGMVCSDTVENAIMETIDEVDNEVDDEPQVEADTTDGVTRMEVDEDASQSRSNRSKKRGRSPAVSKKKSKSAKACKRKAAQSPTASADDAADSTPLRAVYQELGVDEFEVEWWQYIDTPAIKRMKPNDRQVMRQWVVINGSAEDLTVWDDAVKMFDEKQSFKRLPKIAVSRWKSAKYAKWDGPPNPVSFEKIICWGHKDDFFIEGGKLASKYYKTALEDLALEDLRDEEFGMAIDHTIEAAASSPPLAASSPPAAAAS